MQIAPSALESAARESAARDSAARELARIGAQPHHDGGPAGPVVEWSAPGAPRRRPHRFGSMVLLMVIVAGAGAAGVLTTAKRQVDQIARIDLPPGVFSPANPNVENFLLVGSDSREGADPSDPDFAGIGGVDDVTGNRSDTIMVLRRDRNGGPASVLSLPRDLWVDIPGRDSPNRINGAYQDGPATLIETVKGLGIPVHHYVEVDFQGFKSLVDAIGGVTICFFVPARDTHTGFFVENGGCQELSGVQSLAYTRSRYFEQFIDGAWVPDPTSDFGRIKRQQDFINRALQAAIAQVKANPLVAGDVLVSSTGALRLDSGLDVLGVAGALQEAFADGLQTFTPPVYGKNINGNAVLLLGEGAPAYFDYFNGATATPPVPA